MRSPDGRECSDFLRHRKIALTGKRTTTLYLLNPHERRVERVQVDGCAITDGPRCDWLVLLNEPLPREEIYVELKRSHVDRGVEQSEATIKKLSAAGARLRKRCFVVSHRSPITGTDVQKYKDKFFRNFNARFYVVKDKKAVPLEDRLPR